MYMIHIGLALLLIWLNLAALSAIASRWFGDFHQARTAGLLCVLLVLFFIEHFVGLGRLFWLWPLSSTLSVALLWRRRKELVAAGFLRAELVFVLAFTYAFGWRFVFPEIFVSSEKITDLYFISNYLPGAQLPPLDNWNPPNSFGFYYGFQHYAAALCGRILNLSPGATYNIGFSLLMALGITLGWRISCHFIRQPILRLLLVATLVIGGTGLSPLLQLTYSPTVPDPTSSTVRKQQSDEAFLNLVLSARFVGSQHDLQLDSPDREGQPDTTMLAPRIFPNTTDPALAQPLVFPLESFGYQFFLGDFHPPQSGFVLLLLTLALFISASKPEEPSARASQFMLGMTVPLSVVCNTWITPLLGLLILGWMSSLGYAKRPTGWKPIVAGGVIGGLLICPFLVGFFAGLLRVYVRFVLPEHHTPWSRFLALLWPLLVLMSLALLNKRHRHWCLTLCLCWAALLLLSEVIYVDDVTGGKYTRANTIIKWWSWIYVGGLVSLGAASLGSDDRWIRGTAVVTLLLVNLYGIDLVRYWIYSEKSQMGDLDGHDWYTQDPANRAMFQYLKSAPHGVVLENVPALAYMPSSIHAIFNGKPALLGWPSHLTTWHGHHPWVPELTADIREFYQARLDSPLSWLAAHDVQYVVFSPFDDSGYFEQIDQRIGSQYGWTNFKDEGDDPVGVWVRGGARD